MVAIGSPHFVKVSFCVVALILFKGIRILKSFLAIGKLRCLSLGRLDTRRCCRDRLWN